MDDEAKALKSLVNQLTTLLHVAHSLQTPIIHHISTYPSINQKLIRIATSLHTKVADVE